MPNSLYDKINNPDELKKFFAFIPERFLDSDFTKDRVIRLSPKINFDKSLFSKRELHIMNHLVDLYKEIKSKDMTEISHDKKGPWYKVFKKENKPQQIIPYEYILDSSSQSVSLEEANEITKENKEINYMFNSTRSV